MTFWKFFFTTWNWDPVWFLTCIILFVIYGRLWRWKFTAQAVAFFAGLILFFLTMVSPLDLLARGYVFAAHMIQHLLLLLLVPPLFLLGLPVSEKHDGFLGKYAPWAKHPLVGWLAGAGAMWFWHIPDLCSAATSHEWIHVFQAFSLVVLGILFWRQIIGPRIQERLFPLAGVLYLFTACVACTLLGIWITFSPTCVCPAFMNMTSMTDKLGLLPMIRGSWGLTPMEDQQIGGLLMWVPACLVYVGASMILLGKFFSTPKTAVSLAQKKGKR